MSHIVERKQNGNYYNEKSMEQNMENQMQASGFLDYMRFSKIRGFFAGPYTE